jgi:hypothetical protein
MPTLRTWARYTRWPISEDGMAISLQLNGLLGTPGFLSCQNRREVPSRLEADGPSGNDAKDDTMDWVLDLRKSCGVGCLGSLDTGCVQ